MTVIESMHRSPIFTEPANTRRSLPTVLSGLLLIAQPTAHALSEAQFEDVTQNAGIGYTGATWGASWGDFNGDRWPDIWVGNHNYKPILYLNNGDGAFTNVIDSVWAADPRADTHGAAWADFDNDGDQDLIELVGASFSGDDICHCCGQNHLFVNEGGRLVEKADLFGLSQPASCSRSPLWFDADRDGRLDVLVTNTRRDKKPPTLFYHQTDAGVYAPSNDDFGLRDSGRTSTERVTSFLAGVARFRFSWPTDMHAVPHYEFAQIGDLSNDGQVDLILYSQPTRAYEQGSIGFSEITHQLAFPPLVDVTDAAIADFDNDGHMDLYLTVGPIQRSDVAQTSPAEVHGSIMGRKRGKETVEPKAVQFRSSGQVTFTLYPFFMKTSSVVIGARGTPASSLTFSLSSDDPDVKGAPSDDVNRNAEVAIYLDEATDSWTIKNLSQWNYVDFIARSTQPIHDVHRIAFSEFTEEGVDVLLTNNDGSFVAAPVPKDQRTPTACHSVVSGDFDNDMDEDIYLVCTRQLDNAPNRLYENLGNGSFTLANNAGGAAGSTNGRGDVVATADYDGDGFLDLFVTNGKDPDSPFSEKGPHQLYRNLGNDNRWIQIDLVGTISNRDAIGARVIVRTGDTVQVREQSGGMHRLAQNYKRLHFGLGGSDTVDELKVFWPTGSVQTFTNVEVNQFLEIQEGMDTLVEKRTLTQTSTPDI